MKKYDNYKNSGVEWLGEIPEHWEVKKVFHYFKAEKGKNAAILTKDYCGKIEGKFPVYSGQTENNGIMSSINQFEFDFEDDGCLFTTTVGAKAMTVSFLKSKFSLSQNCMIIVKRKKEIYSKFYFYHFQPIFHFFRSQIPDHMQASFRMEDLYKLKFYLPPFQEQTAIANFLDDKTTKIDQAIAIKQQQIELLKERRQILIHKAVTRGLNENVKLKDSGVEWIGEIPEHWEVKKLFGLCNFIRGNSTFSKDELLCNGDYVALQYGKTYKVDEINDDYSFYVNEEFYKETQIVKYDDTILISTSETIEDLGHSAYYKRNDIGLIGGEQILLNPNNKKINGHYLYFYSKLFSKELRKYATGIKVYRFNVNNLKTIYTAIPPLSEQKQIVEFIETATAKIATAISLKEQEIEKLKEYKMSLIDGVVTGKVRVIS